MIGVSVKGLTPSLCFSTHLEAFSKGAKDAAWRFVRISADGRGPCARVRMPVSSCG